MQQSDPYRDWSAGHLNRRRTIDAINGDEQALMEAFRWLVHTDYKWSDVYSGNLPLTDEVKRLLKIKLVLYTLRQEVF